MNHKELVYEVVVLLSDYDALDELSGYRASDDEFIPSIRCNDMFWWGTADDEDIDGENDLKALKTACQDCAERSSREYYWGPLLFVSRKRKLRPQGAAFTHIPAPCWGLFKSAGPPREIDMGNPYEIGAYRRDKAKTTDKS